MLKHFVQDFCSLIYLQHIAGEGEAKFVSIL